MIAALSNLLYRAKDPTRSWQPDPSRLIIDVARCTLCGTPVGGPFSALTPLGPSSVAKAASRGYPEWHGLGIHCVVEDGLLGDMTIVLRPSRVFRAFPGRFLANDRPIDLTNRTTPEQLVEFLGEPFGRSDNDWDDALVFFYEHESGEAQFAFGNDDETLDSIAFWYEPELSQAGACETYGIRKPFPENRRRKLL
jgi:hypothetical protein